MESYHSWWQGRPQYLKFFLPSKLFIWHFPHPIVVELLLILYLLVRVIVPAFKYRQSIKYDILLKVFSFYTEASHNPYKNFSDTEFYNALLLPPYDQIQQEEGCITLSYKDIFIQAYEIKLLQNNRKGNYAPKVPAFQGLCFVVDLHSVGLSGVSEIIITNPPKFIQKKLGENLSKLNLPEIDNLYVYQAQESTILTTSTITSAISSISKIIIANNNLPSKRWDDKIIAICQREKSIDPNLAIAKSLQCAIHKEKLYVLVPLKRGLFEANSVFNSAINNKDIRVILSSLHLTFTIIDSVVNHDL
jgi:hypothetical protein